MPIYELELRVTAADRGEFDLTALSVDGEEPSDPYVGTKQGSSGDIQFDWKIYQLTPDSPPKNVVCHSEAAPTHAPLQIALSARSRAQGTAWRDWVLLKQDDKTNAAGNVALSSWFDIANNQRLDGPSALAAAAASAAAALAGSNELALLHHRLGRTLSMLSDVKSSLDTQARKKARASTKRPSGKGKRKGRGK